MGSRNQNNAYRLCNDVREERPQGKLGKDRLIQKETHKAQAHATLIFAPTMQYFEEVVNQSLLTHRDPCDPV